MICETFQGTTTTTTPQHSSSFHEIDVEKWVSSDENQSQNEEDEENNNNFSNSKEADLSIEEESFSPKSSSSPEPSGSSPEAEEFNSSPDDLDELSNINSKWRASSTSSPSAALGTEVYRLCLPPDSPTTTTTTTGNDDIVLNDKNQQQQQQHSLRNAFHFGELATTSESTAANDEAKDLPHLAPTRLATIDAGVEGPPIRHQVRRKKRYSLDAGNNGN